MGVSCQSASPQPTIRRSGRQHQKPRIITIGKRVLVTGADGFIGSDVAEMLVGNGAQVRALAQYNSFNNWGWLEDVSCRDRIEIVTGDIRDPQFVRGLVDGME